MARVTVEDCIRVVPNRFNLVVLAAQRVKQFKKGVGFAVSEDDDKEPVIALREIAFNKLDMESLKNDIVKDLQNYAIDEDEENYEEDDTYDPTLEVEMVAEAASEPEKEETGDESSIDFSYIIQDEQPEAETEAEAEVESEPEAEKE